MWCTEYQTLMVDFYNLRYPKLRVESIKDINNIHLTVQEVSFCKMAVSGGGVTYVPTPIIIQALATLLHHDCSTCHSTML